VAGCAALQFESTAARIQSPRDLGEALAFVARLATTTPSDGCARCVAWPHATGAGASASRGLATGWRCGSPLDRWTVRGAGDDGRSFTAMTGGCQGWAHDVCDADSALAGALVVATAGTLTITVDGDRAIR
jgi:hypothetical protein